MRNVGVRSNPGDVANQQDIARWSFGTGNPNDAAGAQGDYYVGSDNKLWSKGATTWTFTGVQYGSSAAVPEKTIPVDADILSLGDSANGLQMRKLTWANAKAALLAYFNGQFREKLSAARTYYVRTDGSDSNTGLVNSAAGAFLTIQKAVDVAAALDLGIYDATINVGAGTWTAPTTFKTLVGAGRVVIRGINSDTTSTVISTTASDCFSGYFVGKYHFEWLKLQTINSGYCLYARGGGSLVTWGNVNFGPAPFMHIAAASNASMEAVANYTVSGGGTAHAAAYDCSVVRLSSVVITLQGTPAFGQAFAVSERASSMVIVNNTFSGSATGPRYYVGTNGVMITGAGETYLPGNSAGVKANGGQYV